MTRNFSKDMPKLTTATRNFKDLTRLGVFTRRLRKNPHIQAYLPPDSTILTPHIMRTEKLDAVAGWGMKKKSLKAKAFGAKKNIPYFSLEDGFIHSMSLGRLGSKSWSLVIDSTGIYYDANKPSDLELLILNTTLSTSQRTQATKAIAKIVKHNITKYNNTTERIPCLLKDADEIVLVIDQVYGDLSIEYALANIDSFQTMLDEEKKQNPSTTIFIKTHPDVLLAKKKGCIDITKKLPENVHIITENTNLLSLTSLANKVYVVSSQAGLDALFLEKKVICFGAPFYSGWGLTEDRLSTKLNVYKRRKRGIDLETLFFAAYYKYSIYIHPDSLTPCTLDDILDYLILQHNAIQRFKGKLFCIGFTPWKKRFIHNYLNTIENNIHFPKDAVEAEAMGYDTTSTCCLWSFNHEAEALKLENKYGTQTWKIEDGFIRSISLGSNYAPPSSLVIDKTGLYFDPSKTSDLEKILLTHVFPTSLQLEASLLKKQLIEQEISKYNVGNKRVSPLFPSNTRRRVILIPGQVSDDASILKGCIDINTNLDLIKEVRKKNPNGYLIYKPHPDVLSGNRGGNVPENQLRLYCDLIVEDVSISDCLDQIDEIHTMTSLVGFEGLIRKLKVHCYGVPFYSGWGLTIDRHKCHRRTRKLNINELIAGTLIIYPVYYNWSTNTFTTPDFVANQIHRKLKLLRQKGKYISTIPPKIFTFRKKLNLLKTIFKPSIK